MRKIIITALLLIVWVWAVGQTGVKGKLLDAEEDTPIEYASIAVYKQLDSTLVTGMVTTPEGTFKILDIVPGSYYLKAQFMGYQKGIVSNLLYKMKCMM